jgi:hypothetical protein
MAEILQHYRVTIKLRKTRFFPARAEFVGVDVTKEGNSPAQSLFQFQQDDYIVKARIVGRCEES